MAILAVPRVKIKVEETLQLPGLAVKHLVAAHLLVPLGGIGHRLEAESQEFLVHLEDFTNDAVGGKIHFDCFLVHPVLLAQEFCRVKAKVPGVDLPIELVPGISLLELQENLQFLIRQGLQLRPEVIVEGLHALRGLGHTDLQDILRPGLVAQDLGRLVTEGEHLFGNGRIRLLAAVGERELHLTARLLDRTLLHGGNRVRVLARHDDLLLVRRLVLLTGGDLQAVHKVIW
mmetsp:Transcript_13982/g.39754  ORF Transcript_13982/g.39754 Transcript_13982/m.39754 type:complete len:231 (-) Transcript_13982:721-1413(-)